MICDCSAFTRLVSFFFFFFFYVYCSIPCNKDLPLRQKEHSLTHGTIAQYMKFKGNDG